MSRELCKFLAVFFFGIGVGVLIAPYEARLIESEFWQKNVMERLSQ